MLHKVTSGQPIAEQLEQVVGEAADGLHDHITQLLMVANWGETS